MNNEENEYKGNIAFWYRNSWHHRKKELLESGKTKYGRVGGFKTPEEAEESYYKYLAEYEEQRRNYIAPIIDKEILFKDHLKFWFENIFSQRAESTTVMVTSYIIYYLIIPNLPYEIKTRLVTSDYINEILDKINKVGKTTANRSRETLNMFFKDAVLDNVLTVNPVDSSKQYLRGKTNITILKKKEIKILLELSQNDNWYLETLLALFCGLRKGEIMVLQKESSQHVITDFQIAEKEDYNVTFNISGDTSYKAQYPGQSLSARLSADSITITGEPTVGTTVNAGCKKSMTIK